MDNIKIIENEVSKILENENSGHGMDHILRVLNLSLKISKGENANLEIVKAIALLHDIDDYKIFGEENSQNLSNAKIILNKTNFAEEQKHYIEESLKTIGYSKRLDGINPKNIEAQIVSDADMVDGLGVIGVVRTIQYTIVHNKKIFDENIFPNLNMDSKAYKNNKEVTGINHLFEKILKLKNLMLTKKGKDLAKKRYEFVVLFLKEYFDEMNLPNWKDYLEKYLQENL